MTVFIYGLYDPRTNALRYIGKTIDSKIRLMAHLCETTNTHKNHWLRGLKKLSLKPEMRILETIENSDDNDWQERERWWISAAFASGDPLTNLDAGGRSGLLKCEETRAKMSAAATGRVMSRESVEKMKAAKLANFTEEVRERMRLAQLGKRRTPEQRAAHSIALQGRRVSEETKRKIGAANKISRERYLAEHPPKCRHPKVKKERAPISSEARHRMRLAKL